MVNFDSAGLNPVIGALKPLAYYGSLIIPASAFLLGGITLFIKTSFKKYAVAAMIVSVLSVAVFYIVLMTDLMLNFPK